MDNQEIYETLDEGQDNSQSVEEYRRKLTASKSEGVRLSRENKAYITTLANAAKKDKTILTSLPLDMAKSVAKQAGINLADVLDEDDIPAGNEGGVATPESNPTNDSQFLEFKARLEHDNATKAFRESINGFSEDDRKLSETLFAEMVGNRKVTELEAKKYSDIISAYVKDQQSKRNPYSIANLGSTGTQWGIASAGWVASQEQYDIVKGGVESLKARRYPKERILSIYPEAESLNLI